MLHWRHGNCRRIQCPLTSILFAIIFIAITAEAVRINENLTACQYLRRAELRRSKALGVKIRSPRCRKDGSFEQIQCQNEKRNRNCWCVDEYGVEIPGTRSHTREEVRCKEPDHCPASACRMFCSSGFARDEQSGCSLCRCRDPCQGIECPHEHICQLTEVKCKVEPCPPIPTCKRARSLGNFCPANQPLAIEGSSDNKPYLCGLDIGKPQCPPLYQCMVENGNDYGVCCPITFKFNKPGTCPPPETADFSVSTGYMCGTACSQDLECPNMEKCCFTKGCRFNCRKPGNITTCLQARAMSEILAISEREGRGYIPECEENNGMFAPRQCSRNGLVCWCVDPHTGHKISGTMGAAETVSCTNLPNLVGKISVGRSFHENKCDTNICAAVCEYGFKNDANNCPTCECSDPCDGFKCPENTHCEVTTDSLCESGSTLCTSWPVCRYNSPALINVCDFGGAPLLNNITNDIHYCLPDSEINTSYNGINLKQKTRRKILSSTYEDEKSKKLNKVELSAYNKYIHCPSDYKCMAISSSKGEGICCPSQTNNKSNKFEISEILKDESGEYSQKPLEQRQQTMCEYLRDFSMRMEGTEEGMKLAIPAPICTSEGSYNPRQCHFRTIKVTRADQRKILEENTIRRMRILLANPTANNKNQSYQSEKKYGESVRFKRSTVERLKLYRVDDSLLKVRVSAPISTVGRNAKVIDVASGKHQQSLGQLFETDFKKIIPAPKKYNNDHEMTELEVEECWCVDNFGTEIPRTRGFNVTDEQCRLVREEIDCLDLTCRMGCEYGFVLDLETRCPACQCRDPCADVLCSVTKECRVVEVSCEEEYCAPVPACLPRKPGQCPYLVPPGTNNLDINACSYECRTDSHCEGAKRCCSNGCGTQCVFPQMMTACQHLQSIQMHQSSELGIPAMKMNIAQCDGKTGQWLSTQCTPDGFCWCVDEKGHEMSGTRVRNKKPVCVKNSAFNCTKMTCNNSCEAGYHMDENGCSTCLCRDYCREINCAIGEECQLITVECVDTPCPRMPICVPRRESLCPEGAPLRQDNVEISCGPLNGNESCPSTHSCQLNPVTNRGVCCSKTRDICFESLNGLCQAGPKSKHNSTLYRFSPKANRCVAFTVDMDEITCPIKNFFQSYDDCNLICPILTQCERLKLKNTLAAQRSSHSSIWFKPSCDSVTGNWSPVQCLAKQPNLKTSNDSKLLSATSTTATGVCWCADKKGAPIKGSLTRDHEPICNSRHGRNLNMNSSDILMEELIHQITMLTEMDNFLDEFEFDEPLSVVTLFDTTNQLDSVDVTTKRIPQLAEIRKVKAIDIKTTRCRSLAATATFPVSCDEAGAFKPTQCNQKFCWCVDSAGNQIDDTPMFKRGSYNCNKHQISKVDVELYMQNTTAQPIQHLYEVICEELKQLLGPHVENIEVKSHADGSIQIHFELQHENKIDVAFAIESLIMKDEFKLVEGHFSTDITRSHFIHHRMDLPVYAKVVSHEGTLQLVLFITASVTALTICLFVVYVMVKRGKKKQCTYPPSYEESRKSSLALDSTDFHSPSFVLSPEHDLESIRPPMSHYQLNQSQSTVY